MKWTGDSRRYGAVATAMHWATAVAIFGLLASGPTMDGMGADPSKLQLLRVHATIGILVVVLTLLRFAWWAFAERKPEEPAGMPSWQRVAARWVHRLFYIIILVMGASGLAMLALSGAGPILFAGAQGPLPDFELYPPRAPHGLGAWIMVALIATHIAAALYHQLVLKDRLLARMGLG